MDKGNSSVSHLAWCGLTALHIARIDGQSDSPAQDNLFLTRWLATAEKQRRFPKELASDISWLLTEGRKKGLRADLPGKLGWLWKTASGDPQAQNDLFRLQQALHAVKLAGWSYGVLSDSEWSGRRRRLDPSVAAVYLSRSALEGGFDQYGSQQVSLQVRIAGNLTALDSLLSDSGWRREPAAGEDPMLHNLLAEGFCGE